jgi:tetratricopeptide (TPR) repeat protein
VGLTDWNRLMSVNEIIRRRHEPPLNSQANNLSQLEALAGESKELRQRMDAGAAAAARAIYTQDIQRNPDDYLVRFNYTDFLESIGDAREAVTQWNQIGELLPRYYLVNLELGRMLERLGQLDDAAENYHRALELYPGMSMAWYAWLELGNIHASEGKYAEALDDCERARRLETNNPSIYACMGRVYSKMNRHADAEEKLRQSIRLKPDYLDVRLALAEELQADRKDGEAAATLEEAVRLQPDSARAHLALGMALLNTGQRRAARQQFEQTLRLDPNNAAARQYLSRQF